MNKNVRLKGRLNTYLRCPGLLSILIAAAAVISYFIDYRAGIVVTVCFAVYVAAVIILWLYMRPLVMNELVDFAVDYSQVQNRLIHDLEIPFGIADDSETLLWANACMKNIFGDDISMKPVREVIPELADKAFPDGEESSVYHIKYGEGYYKAEIRRVAVEDFSSDDRPADVSLNTGFLYAVYLFDETEITLSRKDIQDQKMVCGYILIDNYEDALNSTEEVRRSLLSALVERRITKYMQNYDGIVNKLEKDRFMFVMRRQYLPQMLSSKFSVLDEVREINIGNEMNVTLCIGVGVNGESYSQTLDWARQALDLALGRGGDQAVVKDNDRISYYGGKTKQVEKTTRVRARVKAHALRQVILGKDQVVVMGHEIGDMDSVGACIGIYRAARILNKKAYIVLNEANSSVRPMLEFFRDNPQYDSDMFVDASKAEDIVDMNTALVVVDTSISSRTEAPKLIDKTKTRVVIDHHRQSGTFIENPVLSYIEPYASSACEMVCEILQYISDSVKLRPEEADALYAGIMIDTNNFINKTGVRTFEAAAFLKKSGADSTRIRLKLREDLNTCKARAEGISNAVTEEIFAYSVCSSEGVSNPTVVTAQVANELLEISGIQASFVFTLIKDTVYISARSYEGINVQLIMERLGGGGHSTIAGAQLKNVSVDEAVKRVKDLVRSMEEEGEI